MITDVSGMVVTGILFLVTFAWISVLTRIARGKGILAFEPRQVTPWGWIAVALSFFLLIGSQIAVGLSFGTQPGDEPTVAQTSALLTWTAVAILAATVTSIGLIHLFARAGREDFGISFVHVPRDVFTGVYAFFVLAPITFAIQYIFVSIFGIESHHPLIELLKEDSTGQLFGVVTLLAVVVAPISEEYFFRVLLQGWLERVLHFRIAHHRDVDRPVESEVAHASEDATQESIGAEAEPNPYSSPPLIEAVDHSSVASIVPTASLSVVPIAISAAVFALMHWSHGPDPAALFVLALGLGYLYQRTHRWLPCVVMHACLNGTTMLLLWFGLDQLPS